MKILPTEIGSAELGLLSDVSAKGTHIEGMSSFEADELLTRIKFKMVAMW
jgi:hypothetical protein